MEENNSQINAEEQQNDEARIQNLAEKCGQTVDEFLTALEEKQAVKEENETAKNRSTGSQTTNDSGSFDPTGTEFLKGIWGK